MLRIEIAIPKTADSLGVLGRSTRHLVRPVPILLENVFRLARHGSHNRRIFQSCRLLLENGSRNHRFARHLHGRHDRNDATDRIFRHVALRSELPRPILELFLQHPRKSSIVRHFLVLRLFFQYLLARHFVPTRPDDVGVLLLPADLSTASGYRRSTVLQFHPHRIGYRRRRHESERGQSDIMRRSNRQILQIDQSYRSVVLGRLRWMRRRSDRPGSFQRQSGGQLRSRQACGAISQDSATYQEQHRMDEGLASKIDSPGFRDDFPNFHHQRSRGHERDKSQDQRVLAAPGRIGKRFHEFGFDRFRSGGKAAIDPSAASTPYHVQRIDYRPSTPDGGYLLLQHRDQFHATAVPSECEQ